MDYPDQLQDLYWQISSCPFSGVGITGEGFDLCYLGHSGVILLTMLTSLSTATLLLLDHHLHKHHHDKWVGMCYCSFNLSANTITVRMQKNWLHFRSVDINERDYIPIDIKNNIAIEYISRFLLFAQ